MKLDNSEDSELVEKMKILVEENQEGLNRLAEEEPAAKKRKEGIIGRAWRRIRRELGLRKADAQLVNYREPA
mgnify:CR=1 FL=1